MSIHKEAHVLEGTLMDVAAVINVSLRKAQRLAAQGLFVRLQRGVYDVGSSARRYYANMESPESVENSLYEVVDIPSMPCTTVDLTMLFGFTSLRRVQQLTADGVIPKNDDGYVLGEAVRAYCDFLKGVVSAGAASLEAQRTRLTSAQADKAEIEVQVRLGKLVPCEAVSVAWTDLLVAFRTRLLALPSKLGGRLAAVDNHLEIERLIGREVRSILGDLENFDVSHVAESALPSDDEDVGTTAGSDGVAVG